MLRRSNYSYSSHVGLIIWSKSATLQAHVQLGIYLSEVCGGDALKLSQQTALVEPFTMDIGVHQSIDAVSSSAHRLLLSLSIVNPVAEVQALCGSITCAQASGASGHQNVCCGACPVAISHGETLRRCGLF